MKRITPIVHLTNACNLQCQYCYVNNGKVEKNTDKENLSVLLYCLKKIIDWNGVSGTKIIWHGGEPLLLGTENFSFLLNEIVKYKRNVFFSIQTNGTLLNEDYARLFKKYNVHVGISLDGFNDKLNRFRISPDGIGILSKVMKNFELMKKFEVQVGFIMTVNREHIGQERELLDFIQKYQLKCNIRPAYPSGHRNIPFMTPDEFATYFNTLFDIWYINDRKYDTFLVKEFEQYIREELGGVSECHSCIEREDCTVRFLSLDMSGECYPCNRLYRNETFYLGNLQKENINSIISKSKCYSDNRMEALQKKECNSCKYREYCHGGCPAIAYSVYGNYNEKDYYCVAYQKIREHIHNKLRGNEKEIFSGINT